MKKLLASILLLLCLSLQAQPQISTKYVYQYSNASQPPTNYLFLLDPGNGKYQNSSLAQVALQISQLLNLTNGTFVVTNITANTIYVTNLFVTNITAYTESVTLLTATTITNNTFITTNVTIETPGGLTNLNATPKTVAWWDVNDDASSIPNASGVLTNDGSGGIGFSDSISLTEMDVLNFYPTNMFTGLTNYSVLGTDGDGKLTLGSATNSFTATTIYAETNFVDYNYTTNLFYVSGKGNTLIVTNVSVEGTLTNKGIAASSAVITDSHQVETNAVNTHGVFTNTASGPPSFGLLQAAEIAPGISPYFNAINFTNSGYSIPTNNVGGGAFVFGGPGTAATFYDTNITAATTLKLFDITACSATVGGIKLYVTCSGGTDRILTFPAGCSGAGLGTPPAVTITNAKAAFFDIIYKPGATPVTNVFWSPVY